MKKIIFTLLALVGTMSMNAQVMKPGMEILKNGVVVATYTADQADEVVFKEVPAFPFGQGEAEATGIGKVKWVQLWENGPKFAEYNVGATLATEYGGYFEWSSTADIATTQWGIKWRMPKKAELEALLNNQNCTCTWTTQNGVKGLLCKGKENTAYSSNSVFLPAAGDFYDGRVLNKGNFGNYWSSTASGSINAYFLFFSSGDLEMFDSSRGVGYSVRAVLAEE